MTPTGGSRRGDIAIVGMAGRFPGARDVGKFWANLRDGVESVSFYSDEELLAAGVSPAEFNQPNYVKAGSSIEGIDQFDAEFFGYLAREAQMMDPQQRLFLETAWEALEHAGYDSERYQDRIGVFGGAGSNGYLQNVYSNPREVEAVGPTQVLIANEINFLTTRVSYKLDLRGPSVSLRTACSTSLVAVHLACQSLLGEECEIALAGGSYVHVGQDAGYVYQEGAFVSPDGHCRPFDADAQGTIFGSGVGVVVLKPLPAALAAGDTVYAVVKGSAIGNDGALKVGFTAPGVQGQAAAVTQALANAGVDAASIGYVEAHGTGTVLGDPVEIQALTTAFRRSTSAVGYCALGSVKSNFGHLDAASGMAGLIKTVQAVRHEMLPPSLHFKSPNPEIDFAASPFRVQERLTPWARSDVPRRAGVSAFGFGGTNAHVILEEAPVPVPGEESRRGSQLLVLSARTPEALEEATDRLAAHLRQEPAELADAAYTLAVGRRVFPFRRMIVATAAESAAAALETRDQARVLTAHTTKESPGVVFLLAGQGGQYPGMAHELYQQEPVFAGIVDECAHLLRPALGLDLREVMFADPAEGDAARRLEQTELAQPALFVVEYALAGLWRSWGVVPRALLGHSLGEYVAACLAGVFSLPDALHLVALRGRLMQQRAPGAMLSVGADRGTVESLLPGELSLAAHNGPNDCVVAGRTEQVDEFARVAAERGLTARPVATSHAFHSALMEPMVDGFVAAVAEVAREAPNIPFVSNVTGTWITGEQARDPFYWGRHVRAGVEFAAGLETVTQDPDVVLVEIGPGQTLSSLARRAVTGSARPLITASLPHAHDRRGDLETVQRTLGQLWMAGVSPDWDGYHRHERRRRIALPTYPFQRRRYWLEQNPSLTALPAPAGGGRRNDIAQWFYLPSWERTALPRGELPPEDARWLVFTDRCGLGDTLASRLREMGATVVTVAAGSRWARTGAHAYTIDPERGGDCDDLVTSLRDDACLPTHIAHCWSVTPPDEPLSEDTARRQGFESLIHLSKALSRHADESSRRMWVISNGVQNVIDTEPLAPVKATLLGPCRVIPREQPGLRCRSVDIVLDDDAGTRLADQLLREFAVDPAPVPVAYRGAHRWSQHYLPQPMTRPAEEWKAIKEGGVYLITGGTGGLGLALAEHLAQLGAKLLLTARTPVPPEREWTASLQRDPGPGRIGDIVRHLSRIRERGGELLVAEADVADVDQMRGAVRQAVDRWGPINGVFHTAGVAGSGLIQVKSLETAAEVLRPKVDGTLALEQALADQALDFMVLFGSNAANIGDFGQADYCAANSFLDAYAHARARDRRVITVDWGTWRNIGMAANYDGPRGLEQLRQQDVAERGMLPAEGLQALGTILHHCATPQIIVSPTELSVLFDTAFSLGDSTANLDSQLTGTKAATLPRPEIQTVYAPPRGEAERRMCQAWQELLGLERVGIHDSFFDLGGDSLVALQLIKFTNRELGSSLSVVQLYDCLTVSGLSALLERPEEIGAVADAGMLDERRNKVRKQREYQQWRAANRGRRKNL
jgi:acyl transferase domain-containing protein